MKVHGLQVGRDVNCSMLAFPPGEMLHVKWQIQLKQQEQEKGGERDIEFLSVKRVIGVLYLMHDYDEVEGRNFHLRV